MATSNTGSAQPISGNTRSMQRAIWDSYTVAAAAQLLNQTKKLFTSNQINANNVTGDVCNMRATGMLPAGHRHLCRSIRVEMLGAAADMAAMLQYTWLNFKYSGSVVWENALSLATGGVGIPNGASNGLADQRAIYYFDTDPIDIEGQVPIELDVITAGAGNATAAFFLRAYLDGEYTEII